MCVCIESGRNTSFLWFIRIFLLHIFSPSSWPTTTRVCSWLMWYWRAFRVRFVVVFLLSWKQINRSPVFFATRTKTIDSRMGRRNINKKTHYRNRYIMVLTIDKNRAPSYNIYRIVSVTVAPWAGPLFPATTIFSPARAISSTSVDDRRVTLSVVCRASPLPTFVNSLPIAFFFKTQKLNRFHDITIAFWIFVFTVRLRAARWTIIIRYRCYF